MIQDEIMKLQTYKMFEGEDTAYVERDDVLGVLEQEPCEDCVSRAELKKWLDMNFSFGGALRKLELFDRLDKELPSVTPTQEPILDEIRAEIESCREDEEPHLVDYRYCRNEGLDMALDIIDKYKAESEK